MAATSTTPAPRPLAIVILDTIDRLIGVLCRSVVLTTGVALLFSIGTAVVARYVITVGGLDWAEELPKQLFAWFIVAGVVLAVQGGNHIAVDIVMQFLSERVKRVLIVLTNLLIFVTYVVLCSVALDIAEITAVERNPLLGTPGSLPFHALAAGAALTAICTLSIALRVAILGPDARPQGNPEEII